MSDELEAFFELAECTIAYVHHCYEEGLDEDIKADVLDLILTRASTAIWCVSDRRF